MRENDSKRRTMKGNMILWTLLAFFAVQELVHGSTDGVTVGSTDGTADGNTDGTRDGSAGGVADGIQPKINEGSSDENIKRKTIVRCTQKEILLSTKFASAHSNFKCLAQKTGVCCEL